IFPLNRCVKGLFFSFLNYKRFILFQKKPPPQFGGSNAVVHARSVKKIKNKCHATVMAHVYRTLP
ncbi:MAG: hypothetical protein AAGJ87_15470, partial [Pseudomonadota bacterium]